MQGHQSLGHASQLRLYLIPFGLVDRTIRGLHQISPLLMHRHFVCPKCAAPVLCGAACLNCCTISTISTRGRAHPPTPEAATPPRRFDWWSFFGMGRKRRFRRSMGYQSVARMPIERQDSVLGVISRAATSLDMLCAYIVLPILTVLTVLSGVFLILSSLIPIFDVMSNIMNYNGL